MGPSVRSARMCDGWTEPLIVARYNLVGSSESRSDHSDTGNDVASWSRNRWRLIEWLWLSWAPHTRSVASKSRKQSFDATTGMLETRSIRNWTRKQRIFIIPLRFLLSFAFRRSFKESGLIRRIYSYRNINVRYLVVNLVKGTLDYMFLEEEYIAWVLILNYSFPDMLTRMFVSSSHRISVVNAGEC